MDYEFILSQVVEYLINGLRVETYFNVDISEETLWSISQTCRRFRDIPVNYMNSVRCIPYGGSSKNVFLTNFMHAMCRCANLSMIGYLFDLNVPANLDELFSSIVSLGYCVHPNAFADLCERPAICDIMRQYKDAFLITGQFECYNMLSEHKIADIQPRPAYDMREYFLTPWQLRLKLDSYIMYWLMQTVITGQPPTAITVSTPIVFREPSTYIVSEASTLCFIHGNHTLTSYLRPFVYMFQMFRDPRYFDNIKTAYLQMNGNIQLMHFIIAALLGGNTPAAKFLAMVKK